MEGAGQGSSQRRMAGSAGFVCGEGGNGDIVHKGKLFDGLGEEKGGASEEETLK